MENLKFMPFQITLFSLAQQVQTTCTDLSLTDVSVTDTDNCAWLFKQYS